MAADLSILSDSPLFKSISAEEILKVLERVPYKIRKFKSGSLIAQTGDRLLSFHLILSGSVKGEMVDYAGRIIKIEDVHAPHAIAAAFLFGDRNIFPVNVVTTSDTRILVIDKDDFLRLLGNDKRILSNFLDMMSNRSQFLSDKIKFLNFKTIKGKLAQFILQRTTPERPSFRLEMTQSDLADYFGVARPSVARAVGELEDEGCIEASGKQILVTDRKRLLQMTDD
ncbi:MAG: Crp/Fnr family transcriptional regulator [Bacteroidales bacterium]|nr:Crp/Fnr family transcriptional regulator [Bacteroidales bacterium]